ncbi:unnamed protein product [Clavelina lepadiformis]|uniref:Uncharacterized protein n=1 Tax=Clavelina lepadiformis TaxID=159417 RepID=A0ABP0G4J0_CLALP
MIKTEQIIINGRNQFTAGARLICNPIKEQKKCKQLATSLQGAILITHGRNVSYGPGVIISRTREITQRRENFQEPREVLASPEGTSPYRDSPARASRA